MTIDPQFEIASELRYSVASRSTIILNLHAVSNPDQDLRNESFLVTDGAKCEFIPADEGNNRYVRIDTSDVTELVINYSFTAETNPCLRGLHENGRVPLANLDSGALPYLFPSRYCQSDRLGLLAFKLFGQITDTLAQAVAVSDWIFENVDYVPGSTNASTSAFDTVTQRTGVCRDFAHLGIAFCRALSIPARYVTAYACDMQPPDFHACFEACVGNQWYLFDPTRLAALNGLVRIASGRDAADASQATIFGDVYLESIYVSCTAADFEPWSASELDGCVVLLAP